MVLGSETDCAPVVIEHRKEDNTATLPSSDILVVSSKNISIVNDIDNGDQDLTNIKNKIGSIKKTIGSLRTVTRNTTEQIKEAFAEKIQALNKTIQNLRDESSELSNALSSARVQGLPEVSSWPESERVAEEESYALPSEHVEVRVVKPQTEENVKDIENIQSDAVTTALPSDILDIMATESTQSTQTEKPTDMEDQSMQTTTMSTKVTTRKNVPSVTRVTLSTFITDMSLKNSSEGPIAIEPQQTTEKAPEIATSSPQKETINSKEQNPLEESKQDSRIPYSRKILYNIKLVPEEKNITKLSSYKPTEKNTERSQIVVELKSSTFDLSTLPTTKDNRKTQENTLQTSSNQVTSGPKSSPKDAESVFGNAPLWTRSPRKVTQSLSETSSSSATPSVISTVSPSSTVCEEDCQTRQDCLCLATDDGQLRLGLLPMCWDDWDQQKGNTACRLLGFGSQESAEFMQIRKHAGPWGLWPKDRGLCQSRAAVKLECRPDSCGRWDPAGPAPSLGLLLNVDTKTFCPASLLSPLHLLAAASCILPQGADPKAWVVFLGQESKRQIKASIQKDKTF